MDSIASSNRSKTFSCTTLRVVSGIGIQPVALKMTGWKRWNPIPSKSRFRRIMAWAEQFPLLMDPFGSFAAMNRTARQAEFR